MCTVSWLHQDGGYHLFCNRDEKRTRAEAQAPEVRNCGPVCYAAPVDRTAGGAWIGTNQYGISLCLLNGATRDAVVARRSRGLVIPTLMNAASLAAVCQRVWEMDLSPFAPFTLVILEPFLQTAAIAWDGSCKSIVPSAGPFIPLVSSSFDPEGVRIERRRQFQQVTASHELDPDALVKFHRSHAPVRGAYSPCMHRPDARTVSFSHVTVTRTEAIFFYVPGAPCLRTPGVTLRLPLAQ